MSYQNVGGYNPSQMSYSGGAQPNYPGAQQGGYGASAPPPGYGQGNYQGSQQGGYGTGQAGGYPGGGHHPGGPSVNPDIQRWFSTVDRDHSGKISAKELQAALINGQGKNFSDQACSLMIGLFDHDKSGTIDVQEFQQLYNYINQWIATFRTYDRDHSGHIEESELNQAFQQMGFKFSPEFIKFLIAKSDLQNHAKITVDQFIVLCVQIQRFTELTDATQSYFDKSKRKRKAPDDGDAQIEELDGVNDQNSVKLYKVTAEDINKANNALQDFKEEVKRLKGQLNHVVTENADLIKENKQLQEKNLSLQKKAALLEEENQKLRSEHGKALELSSWLNSAKDIVRSLSEQTKNGTSSSRSVQPASSLSREQPWNGGDKDDNLFANGNSLVKQERLDDRLDDDAIQEGEEYHTPLLSFDQVEYPPKDEPMTQIFRDTFEPDSSLDDVGRDQLLHPDPVDGVCEIWPGSRIYVSFSAMEIIMHKRSHSSVARSCLEAIFKTTYLLSCSVQGNAAKGPYGKPEFQRPSLYKPAVDCILRFSRHYAETNGWKIEELSTVKKQMNTRLSELRNIAKSKNALASQNQRVENRPPEAELSVDARRSKSNDPSPETDNL